MIIRTMIVRTRLLFAMLAAAAPFALHADAKQSIQQLKEEAARSIAMELRQSNFSATASRLLAEQASSRGEISIPLHDLLASVGVEGHWQLQDIDRQITEAKGLADWSQGVLQLRLHLPRHVAGAVPAQLNGVLVAVEPSSDERERLSIPAFDANGMRHDLDPKTPPQRPVLILDIDGKETARAGALLINNVLQRSNLQMPVRSTPFGSAPVSSSLKKSGGTTLLTHIVVQDRLEDWTGGAAEIFAVVAGIHPNGTKPQIQLKDMPYLQWELKNYRPNQEMVNWNDFGFGYVSVTLIEQDDNASYAELAASIVASVNKLARRVDKTVGSVAMIGNAVLLSINNGNDLVDQLYPIGFGETANQDGKFLNANVNYCFRAEGRVSC